MTYTNCDNCLKVIPASTPRVWGAVLCAKCAAEEQVRDAAPDLLQALRDLLYANDKLDATVHARRIQAGQPCDCRVCAERAARAAIHKATSTRLTAASERSA